MQLLKSNEYVTIDGGRFDVLKFILSLFVVGLHIDFCYPLKTIFRLAVPLFFMMTSYFFFLKQNSLDSQAAKKKELMKYCKRILKLYLFWFIVLLPLTIYYHKWYQNVDLYTFMDVCKTVLLGDAFKASWFLMACLLAIILVWFLSHKVKTGLLFGIGFVLYSFCCMTSNYYHLCERIPHFAEFYNGYVSILSVPFNSFPAALIFVLMGKYLSDHAICFSNKRLFLLIAFLFVVYFFEFYFVWKNRFVVADDCYFSLMPLSMTIFMLIGQNYIKINADTKKLRKYSTIIFCSHFSFGSIILMIIQALFGNIRVFSYEADVLVAFIITVVVCLLLCRFLLWLEKKTHFKWVKYSH